MSLLKTTGPNSCSIVSGDVSNRSQNTHKHSRKASRRASVRLKEPAMVVGTAVTVDRQQPIVTATTSAARSAVAVDRQQPIVTATTSTNKADSFSWEYPSQLHPQRQATLCK